jgi:hypothetical protein
MESVKSAEKDSRELTHVERGAAIRGECGEILGHGGSCHVGDDTRS